MLYFNLRGLTLIYRCCLSFNCNKLNTVFKKKKKKNPLKGSVAQQETRHPFTNPLCEVVLITSVYLILCVCVCVRLYDLQKLTAPSGHPLWIALWSGP